MPPLASAGVPEHLTCMQHDAAATRLGAQRRRLFLMSAVLGILAPLLPYLTGTWEAAWFGLAATGLPYWLRMLLFLLAFHAIVALVLLPLSYYGGYVLAHAFGLSRQSLEAWLIDWLKGAALGTVLGSAIGGAFLWIVIAFGDHWWWVFGLLVTVLMVVLVFVTPYVLVPLFFKMRPLADEGVVARIKALVNQAGTPVRDVCSLDFSR